MKCAETGCTHDSEYAPVLEISDEQYSYPKVYIALGISFCKTHCKGTKEEYLKGQEETISSMFKTLGYPMPSLKFTTLKFWPIGQLQGQLPVLQVRS